MIPKIIHYCWFGDGQMSALHQRCVDSWRKYCPDYELRLWNESNSDIDNVYCKEAIARKKWAFVADYVRFDALAKHGGIYLDTDVELIGSLDSILGYDNCVIARESPTSIGTGFIACLPGDPVMTTARRLMAEDLSRQRLFATSPVIVKHAISLNAPQSTLVLAEDTFYPFNPYDHSRQRNARQLMFSDITASTIGIHHYGLSISWVDHPFKRLIARIRQALSIQLSWDLSFAPFDSRVR
jgi:mannosyltransferase OCH1-like enzyme